MKLQNITLGFRQRLILLCFCILFWKSSSQLNSILQRLFISAWEVKSVIDSYQWFSLPISHFLLENEKYRKLLLISDALFIDFVSLFLMFYWCYKPTMSAIMISAGIFYSIRAFALAGVSFPHPDPYLFLEPDFPSLFVSYRMISDMYYSGHTGILTIYMLFSRAYNWNKFRYVCVTALLLTIFMLMVAGVHFFNDIIIGYMVARIISYYILGRKYEVTLSLITLFCWIVSGIGGVWISAICQSRQQTTEESTFKKLNGIKFWLENI